MTLHIRGLSDGERAIQQQDGPEDFDTGPKILDSRTCVARKAYACDTCKIGGIAAGETYHRLVILGDEGFEIQRFCTKPEPPTAPGNWHCESERLQSEQHDRDLYVSGLTADGAMTEADANAAYDRHLAAKAEAKAAQESRAAAERAARTARPRGPDKDLPF